MASVSNVILVQTVYGEKLEEKSSGPFAVILPPVEESSLDIYIDLPTLEMRLQFGFVNSFVRH